MPHHTPDEEKMILAHDPVPGYRPAFLIAFPRPQGLDLPTVPVVGRDWLRGHGLADQQVSKQHFKLSTSGGVCIEDVASRHGTWVDGERLRPGQQKELGDGAVIRIGNTVLVYRKMFHGQLAQSENFGKLVSPFGLRKVFADARSWTREPPRTVLVEGETGTGKELLNDSRVKEAYLGA